MQGKEKILRLPINLQCLKGHLFKCNNDLDLEEESDAWFFLIRSFKVRFFIDY